MKTTKVRYNRVLVNELMKRTFIFDVIITIVGVLVFVPFLVLFILIKDYYYILGMMAGLVAMGLGIFSLAALYKGRHRFDNTVIESVIEFNENDVHAVSYKDGNKSVDNNFRYEDIIYYRVSKNYIFIYLGKNAVWPLNKDDEKITSLLDEKGVNRK